MAVCNLFNELTSTSSNFLMFSQYVEDLTRNNSDGDNWKVIPSKFIALDIDYSNTNINIPSTGDLNIDIPMYFQNYYENGCAYGKNNKTEIDWTPDNAKNFFWNALINNNLISVEKYDETTSYIPEIVYYDDINMYSYNEHQGLGYSELYCYIPSNANKIRCQVIKTNENVSAVSNNMNYLEGFNDNDNFIIGDYNKTYYYNHDYIISAIDDNTADLPSLNDITSYNINTIVVLYSIYVKQNNEWITLYSNIPMGIYFAGNFNNTKLTNEITKHVTTSYNSGTSYGLRICTRFSATSNGKLINTDITTDNSDYANICQMMTGMNENLSRMLDVTKTINTTTQDYKDSLSVIKNNRTNIPYIKIVNGEEYWFINGRKVSPAKTTSFIPIDNKEISDYIDNYTFNWIN